MTTGKSRKRKVEKKGTVLEKVFDFRNFKEVRKIWILPGAMLYERTGGDLHLIPFREFDLFLIPSHLRNKVQVGLTRGVTGV